MTTPNATIVHAFSRFGFGGRPSDGAPTGIGRWLSSQLQGADPLATSEQTTVGQGLDLCYSLSQAKEVNDSALIASLQAKIYALWGKESSNLFVGAVTTPAPFRERLVWFWMNHFGITSNSAQARTTGGAFVRDAIRPFVTGNYADMLQAAIHHPSMLFSLDNVGNRGAQSPIGLRLVKAGRPAPVTNQNLGRETLELYTVGVDGGYTQADVIALANLLTGLQVNIKTAPRGYLYDPECAQAGTQVLLGQTFDGTDAGSRAALQMLATHPATYTHLATKLVTHFVSDTPAAADIASIAGVLASTGGNIGAAAQAIINLTSAWTPLEKVRTPSEHAIAIFRAMNASASETLALMDHTAWLLNMPWCSKFPNGWSDQAIDWIGPTQIAMRFYLAGWLPHMLVPSRTAQKDLVATTEAASVLPFLSSGVSSAVASVAGAENQLTVLFTLPEFMRR